MSKQWSTKILQNLHLRNLTVLVSNGQNKLKQQNTVVMCKQEVQSIDIC